MTLTCKDPRTIQTMGDNDCATSGKLEKLYGKTPFVLSKSDDDQETALCCLDQDSPRTPVHVLDEESTAPILPPELSWLSGSMFLVLQCLIVVALIYTWIRANMNDGNVPKSTVILF